MRSTRRLLRALVALAAVSSAVAVSGCSVGGLELRAGSVTPKSTATIAISPAPSGAPVAPVEPVVVRAAAGRLTQVSVTGPDGAVNGTLSVDGRTFTVEPGALDYAATYQVTATAVDRVGVSTESHGTLVTVAPSTFIGFVMSPRAGATVGVGMPVKLDLDHRLTTKAERAAFERTLSVTADGSPVEGAWRWATDDVVSFRPAVYWPGHARIAVTAALKGYRISRDIWGEKDRTISFSTGAAMISTVDVVTDLMTVTMDGTPVRTIPITTGKVGFETRGGIKVISAKERTRVMDAATGGTDPRDPEYYRLEVEYAMRLTNSGEFLHAAPWSVAHQGHENVSHGCTGMSTENAAWLYSVSSVGDVVVYTGSARVLEPGNGITVWNLSLARWARGSALS